MSQSRSSRRTKAAEGAKARRLQMRDWRRQVLDAIASGFTYRQVADRVGVDVATVKRHVNRALAERAPEPAETFVALQRERLNKALRYMDTAMEQGDMRAAGAMVALLPQLERYWGLQAALAAQGENGGRAHVLPVNPRKLLETQTQLPPPAAELAPAEGGLPEPIAQSQTGV